MYTRTLLRAGDGPIRPIALAAALTLILAGSSTPASAGSDEACPEHAAPAACPTPSRHGTLIDWWADEAEAARRAREEGKLLFVLHLAGDFPDDGRT